jgi:hypothetical protein
MSDKALDYDELTDPGWDLKAAETSGVVLEPDEVRPDAIRVIGPCPRCSHEVHHTSPLVLIGGGLPGADRALREELLQAARDRRAHDLSIICSCSEEHRLGKKGCGAMWSLHVAWGD